VLQGLLVSDACSPWQASAAGFVIACAFNYSLQRLWVFQSNRSQVAALPRYVAITTVMLGINTMLFTALSESGLPPLVAQTVTTGCVFVLNFFGNRYFTFGALASVGTD
jgi:putative flippase GtrA